MYSYELYMNAWTYNNFYRKMCWLFDTLLAPAQNPIEMLCEVMKIIERKKE